MTRFQQEMRRARERLEAAKIKVIEQSLVWHEEPNIQRMIVTNYVDDLLRAAEVLEITRTKHRPIEEYFE